MMARVRSLISCLIAALLITLAASASIAAEKYSDAKLRSFVSASLAANAIVERRQQSIRSASSEAEKQKLTQQMNFEIIDALSSVKGISFQEYMAIAQSVQADPRLRARLEQIAKDMAR